MAANFLVIQLARLGDLLQSKRLILSLQEEGQVFLLVDKSLQKLAKLLYPQTIVFAICAHGGGLQPDYFSETYKTFQQLKKIDFLEVYNLNFSPLNFVCAKIFPQEIVFGYSHKNRQDIQSPWTRKAFSWIKNRKLSPLNLVDFWAFLKKDKHKIYPAEKVNPEPKNRGEGIGVVLAGRNLRRSLQPESLASLIEVILKKQKMHFFLLGSQQEQKLARELKKCLTPGQRELVKDLTGKTSLEDLLDLLPELEVVVTPDTGLMHLSAHLGTKVWAFFLSSAWAMETGPYGKGHKVIQSFLSCAPCVENKKCLFKHKCHLDFGPKLFYHLVFEQEFSGKQVGVGESFLDKVGVNYKFSFPPSWFEQRERIRRSIQQYLLSLDLGETYSDFLFSEREWLLP